LIKQSGTYDPSFFERLKKAEAINFWFQIRRKWIFDRIKKFIAPSGRVLEVGCGTGDVSSFLAQKGYVVTGFGFYPEAVNIA
jgi:2-polyprenyl-3-methyl-5-hydroxy-6-metoxy-1,4-benzoquinol methylase